jgi:formylmethanofuran dehydrogenase subunit E
MFPGQRGVGKYAEAIVVRSGADGAALVLAPSKNKNKDEVESGQWQFRNRNHKQYMPRTRSKCQRQQYKINHDNELRFEIQEINESINPTNGQ